MSVDFFFFLLIQCVVLLALIFSMVALHLKWEMGNADTM